MSGSLDLRRIGLGVALALAVGALLWMALGMLAKPSDFDRRSSEVEARIARVEDLARASAGGSSLGPHALCPSVSSDNVELVKRGLATAAAGANVALSDLVARAPENVGARGRIAPVAVRLQGSGAYDAVLSFLETVAQSQPEVFVDGLDLVSAPPNVTFKLNAKVFCWTSEPR